MRFQIKYLCLFICISIITSCKKDIKNEDPITDAVVNYSGSIADPNAIFTPFQIPAGGTTTIPTNFDLSPNMPPIRNQYSQGSCVGFGLSTLKSYHEKLEYGYNYSGDDKIMSPAFIYNQIKLYGDCGAGSNMIIAMNFLKQNGVSTEQEFPYVINNCSTQPSQTIKTNALRNKIRDWQGFIFYNNPDVLDEMKFAISQLQPIVIDFRVDAEFTAYNSTFSWGTNIWQQNTSGDPTIFGVSTPGYHCALLVGYDDAKNAFKLLNSWGSGWENQGYCWVDYSWFLQRVRFACVTWDESNTLNNGNLQVTGDLNFGNILINTTATKVIQLKNIGTTNINISSVSITSPYSVNWNNGTIQPNVTVDVSVSFNPTSLGTLNKTLTINSDATNNVVTVQASGTGVQQSSQTKIISLSGNLSFGNVTLGQTSSKALTILNNGNTTLNVNSISSTDPRFSGNWSGPIPAGSSITTPITFAPSNVQNYNSTILVVSDATSGINTINANGNGVQQTTPTRIISLSGSLSFGNVSVGQSNNKTLTVENSGNSTLYVNSISSTDPRFSGNWSGPIPAGGSISTSINFAPSNAQTYNGTISVNSDATSGTYTKNATGTGISNFPTVEPPLGTYGNCVASGSYNCPPLFGLGVIKARVVSINTSTHEMVVEMKKCNGTPFNSGGNINVVNYLCGGTGAVSYGFTSFPAGVTTFQMTITDPNMVGSKAYVLYIVQPAANYSAPAIVITY